MSDFRSQGRYVNKQYDHSLSYNPRQKEENEELVQRLMKANVNLEENPSAIIGKKKEKQ